MENLSTQIEFDAKIDGAQSKIGQLRKDLGSLKDVAQGTGKAFDGQGKGAEKAATEVERATRRQINEIRRLTAEIESGGKATRAYHESLASIRGADTNALRPYLDQLEQARTRMHGLGTASADTARQLRMVGPQFTDIVTQLSGGQNALQVFIQQGGQLKDMFGGAGAAAKALGSYVVGLVNPYTVAAAAIAAVGTAYYKGSQEAEQFQRALIMSGNASGTTAGQLQDMAHAMTDIGITQSNAAAALASMAQLSGVAADKLKDYTSAAVQWAEATGKEVSKIAGEFKSLGTDPLASVLKLNESLNFLTTSTYDQIKALQEQGRMSEAARVAQDAYARTISVRSQELVNNLGTLERVWRGVANWAKQAWDVMLSIGRAPAAPTADALKKQMENIDAALKTAGMNRGLDTGQYDFLRQRRAELVKQLAEATAKESKATEAANAQSAIAARAEFDRRYGSLGKSRQEQMAAEIEKLRNLAREGHVAADELDKKVEAIKAKYAETKRTSTRVSSGRLSADQSEAARIKSLIVQEQQYVAALQERGEAASRLTTGEKLVIQIQQQLQEGLKGTARVRAEEALAMAKQLVGVEKQRKALEDEVKARKQMEEDDERHLKVLEQQSVAAEKKNADMRAELAALGLSREEVATLAAARLEDSIATLEQQKALALVRPDRERETEELQRQIDALRERQRLTKDIADRKDALEREKKLQASIKQADEEARKAADDIEKSLTDALLRGFESGKDFARNFRDTLRNMFNTLVLRPVISMVVQPVAGQIQALLGSIGLLGAGTAHAAQGAGAGSNLLGALGNYGQFFANGASLLLHGGWGSLGSNVSALWGNGAQGSALATGAGGAATAFGGILGGRAIGQTISGGFSAWGSSGNRLNNVGAAAGAAIGSIIPGIGTLIGGLIGGALGGVLNRVFGRKLKDAGLEGDFGGAAGFSGRSWQYLRGGLFRSDKTRYGPLEEEMRAALATPYMAMREQLRAYADVLKLPTEKIDAITHHIKLSLRGLKPEEIQQRITEALGAAQEELAQSILNEAASQRVSDAAGEVVQIVTKTAGASFRTYFQREGETAVQTLQRLATSLTAVNSAFDMLGHSLFEASVRGGDLASRLIEQFGNTDNFNQAVSGYYQNFYSDEERRERTRQALQRQLTTLGVAVPDFNAPDAREQFRRIVEGLDLTTEAGRKAFAALLGVQGAFASVTESAEQLAEKLRSATDAAWSALSEQYGKAIDKARALADAARGVFTEAGDARRSLQAQVASAAETAALRGRAFIDQAARSARANGQLPDAEQLRHAIEAATHFGMGNYATVAEMDADKAILAAKLGDIEGVAGTQLTAAEQQVKLLEEQRDYWQEQIKLLRNQGTTVSSISEGVAALVAAMEAERAQKQRKPEENKPASGSTGAAFGGGPHRAAGPAVGKYDDKTGRVSFDGHDLLNYIDTKAKRRYYRDGSSSELNEQELAAILEAARTGKYVRTNYGNPRVPGFASGGLHTGGLRIVGEKGPEIEATGPARYWTFEQTKAAVNAPAESSQMGKVLELLHRLVEHARRGEDLTQREVEAVEAVADGRALLRVKEAR